MKRNCFNNLIPVVALALGLSLTACGRMEQDADGFQGALAAMDGELGREVAGEGQASQRKAILKQLRPLRQQLIQNCREYVKSNRDKIQGSGKGPLQFVKENREGAPDACKQALSNLESFIESVKAKRKGTSAG